VIKLRLFHSLVFDTARNRGYTESRFIYHNVVKTLSILIEKGGNDYVMDNYSYPHYLMASRFYWFLRWFVNPPTVGNSSYTDCSPVGARQKNYLTDCCSPGRSKLCRE